MIPEESEEQRELHLNEWFETWYPVLCDELGHGFVPDAVISGLVNAAKMIADNQSDHLPIGYFEECVIDVLQGGDGLKNDLRRP